MTFFSMDSNDILAEINGQPLLFSDVECAKSYLNSGIEFIVFDKSFNSFVLLYACLYYLHPFMVIHPKWPKNYINNYKMALAQYACKNNACFLPTSGSTGAPKLVCHDVNSLFSSAKRSLSHIPISPSDRIVLSLPPTGMGGLLTVVKSLISGARLIFNYDHWSHGLMRLPNIHFTFVPQQLQYFIELSNVSDFSIASILVGGDGVSYPLIQQCNVLGLPVIYSYGLTETCGQAVSTSLNRMQYLPLNNISIDTYDGRLLIGCDTLAKGYLSINGFSKLSLMNGMFLTNDLVDLDPEFKFVGRSDFQFQSGSLLVNPQFIEAELIRSGFVSVVIVIPQLDDRYGLVPIAYVPTGATIHQLTLFSRDNLPLHLQPRQFLHLPDMFSFEDPMCRQQLIRLHQSCA